jgi:PiT family inorganic phosphate transporter
VTLLTIVCALLAGILWNLLTWFFGIPSSSSHALIGGLCGAVLAQTGFTHPEYAWEQILLWNEPVKNAAGAVVSHAGLWPKLIKPMLVSPVCGFALGAAVMFLLTALLVRARPAFVQRWFGRLQILSAGGMALGHGMNDAQKTMGIITLALVTGSTAANGVPALFDSLPAWLGFLKTAPGHIPFWVQVLCALTIAAGTAGGGWRIIRTMGHKMVKLQPVHGFAAETSAAAVIQVASHLGIPLSTTHVISTSIMGVGAMRRFSAVKWGLVGRIVWAWVLTLPVTAAIGYAVCHLLHWTA